MKLVVGWLYSDLMSLYGDRGNIICLTKRCQWRKIDVEVREISLNTSYKQLATCNMLFMGGAQDRQQKLAAQDLRENKGSTIKEMIENFIPGLFICGAYQFMGHFYRPAEGKDIKGLGIFDLYTVHPGKTKKRCIGNIVVKTQMLKLLTAGRQGKTPTRLATQSVAGRQNHNLKLKSNRQLTINNQQYNNFIVGFENHGGRTHLGKKVKPLGEVIVGFGNNGEDGTEGCVYKNAIGSYLHGPILPKNPHLADFLIKLALEKKYGNEIKLEPLDDTLEWQAHKFMLQRLGVKHIPLPGGNQKTVDFTRVTSGR